MLNSDDFVSIKANWQQKDRNLQEIAEELSLGIDSFVFVDDNPAERELVKKQISEVAVPSLGDIQSYIRVLDHSGYFEATMLSDEDLKKTEQYRARADASREKTMFESYDEYLDSLRMQAIVTGFEPVLIQRVAQLTNKTNQFNLTTLRCSENDICLMQNDLNYICLCARLTDRFTDHGIVSVVAGEIQRNELHLRLWLMSCRVLQRRLEDFMMNQVVRHARQCGVKRIVGYYCPSGKNSMVSNFYPSYGFDMLLSDENGNCTYCISPEKYAWREVQIEEAITNEKRDINLLRHGFNERRGRNAEN